METQPAQVSALMAQYGIENESELEVYYPGAQALLLRSSEDAEVLGRLVRVVAVNKALVQRGLEGLCMSGSSAQPVAISSKEESEEEELTAEERRVLEQSDGGGLVNGIPVGHRFYWRCLSKCRSKRARLLAKNDPNAFKQFILRFLKGLAKEELRREALGLSGDRSSSSCDLTLIRTEPSHTGCW